MLKQDVLDYFKTQVAAARAVGISKQGVWMWPEVVPQAHAWKLQILTEGKLKVDPSLYPKVTHPTKVASTVLEKFLDACQENPQVLAGKLRVGQELHVRRVRAQVSKWFDELEANLS